jgi:hypothetical protein
MKSKPYAPIALVAVILLLAPRLEAETKSEPAKASDTEEAEASKRADQRYDEMLERMKAAVQEIAQLYGNPVFLQVFTNDPVRAAELKERLSAIRSKQDAEKAEAQLLKGREELMADIALKDRESKRLSMRLAKQRVALDSLAAAVEQARRAVEDTSP